MAPTTRNRGHAGNAVAQLPFSAHIIQAPSQGMKLPTVGVSCLLLPQTRRVRREAEQTRQLWQVLGDHNTPTQDPGDAIIRSAALSLLHWLWPSDVMAPSVSWFQGSLPLVSRGSFQGGSSQTVTTSFSWLLASSYKWASLSTSMNIIPHRHVHVPTSKVILDFMRLTINRALGTGQLWYIINV